MLRTRAQPHLSFGYTCRRIKHKTLFNFADDQLCRSTQSSMPLLGLLAGRRLAAALGVVRPRQRRQAYPKRVLAAAASTLRTKAPAFPTNFQTFQANESLHKLNIISLISRNYFAENPPEDVWSPLRRKRKNIALRLCPWVQPAVQKI